MQTRGAIDFPISIIVIVLICIVMVIGGLLFLNNFLKGTEQTVDLVNSQNAQRNEEFVKTPRTPKSTQLLVMVEEDFKEPESQVIEEPKIQNLCLEDLSCEKYFIFVPIGNWRSDTLFEEKVKVRADFFIDISKFKFNTVGIISVPIDYACKIPKMDQRKASDHLKIKKCADQYANVLGIEYEKAIGLSNLFEAGRTFFNGKAVYSSLGYTLANGELSDRPGIVAHELGHSYNLCDEYSFADYNKQKTSLKFKTCSNKFPVDCSKDTKECLGNTPVYRTYQGTTKLKNSCLGGTMYSVMGFSKGGECGFDATGGYSAIQ
jgi:hypothetical protein